MSRDTKGFAPITGASSGIGAVTVLPVREDMQTEVIAEIATAVLGMELVAPSADQRARVAQHPECCRSAGEEVRKDGTVT